MIYETSASLVCELCTALPLGVICRLSSVTADIFGHFHTIFDTLSTFLEMFKAYFLEKKIR